MLVDGRNRREACRLAGYRPEVRLLNGEDPNAYVRSANLHRRNLTPAQRAMAEAMIRPEPQTKGGRGKTSTDSSGFRARVREARAILRYSPELAQAVVRGDKPLHAALAEARQSQGNVLNARSRLAKLRDERPDLAEMVANKALSLDERSRRRRPRPKSTSSRSGRPP
jgi:hypothetical protein